MGQHWVDCSAVWLADAKVESLVEPTVARWAVMLVDSKGFAKAERWAAWKAVL